MNSLRLTPRQLEILELVSLGLTNQQIADRFVVERSTVQNHTAKIYAKLKLDIEYNQRVLATRAYIRYRYNLPLQ